MIAINIIKSPRVDEVGKVQVEYDLLKIGKNLILEVIEDQLIVSTGSSDLYYLSNNKKYSGKRYHRKDDLILFEKMHIKIINFKSTYSKPIDMKKSFADAVEEDPRLQKILEIFHVDDKV